MLFVNPPSTFILNYEEVNNIKEWLEAHTNVCPYFRTKTTEWFGGPIHYIFTPDRISTSIQIKCDCGAEADVGGYENMNNNQQMARREFLRCMKDHPIQFLRALFGF